MLLRFVVLLSVGSVIGCSQRPATEAANDQASGETPRAEISLGDEGAALPFKIVAVYENQEPSKTAPFHVGGGEWLYFDCQGDDDAKAHFTVGVLGQRSSGGSVQWGRAAIVVADRETGTRLSELFHKSFGGELPPPRNHPYLPEPLLIHTAILGEDMKQGAAGGFSGEGGGWTATKWFPTCDGHEGEIYFNYNLAKRIGEFSEKDSEYADDLMAIWASALRDGPKPERTPGNDPNLTLEGPQFGRYTKLFPHSPRFCSFTSNSRFVVVGDGPTVLAMSLDGGDGEPFEIASFEHSLWEMQLVNDDLGIIVCEAMSENPGIMRSSDPMRIWWIDHKKKLQKLLRGPEDALSLAEVAVSPDRRYVALDRWQGKPGGKDRKQLLTILDRESGMQNDFDLTGKGAAVIDWERTPAGFRAVVMTDRWRLYKDEPSKFYLADPSTGTLELKDDGTAAVPDDHLSPDKKHRYQIGGNDLAVIDLESGSKRNFVFHEDDQQFVGEDCVEWASPRYLKFNASKLALIDVTTMKMCFPKTADGARPEGYSCRFSPDFHWVLYEGDATDEGLFLAPVQLPE